ncbi:MAG: hypothetical protein MJZ55_05785, partial [Paludibacteraceae bacterium]|nr:hypothetical protein [Paludibacteraceae bacterium]
MYNFSYEHIGGATRVKLQKGEDLRHLGELDQKKWTVLSCPASGLEISDESLKLMDLDGDNQLRVNEVIRTADWLCAMLKDPQTLFLGLDEVDVDNIADAALKASAAKVDKKLISLASLAAYVDAITVAEDPAPEAPYAADVMAAYKAKKDEYAAYFEQEKLQKLGLAVIAEDTPKPGMKESEFVKMGAAIDAYEAALTAVNDKNAAALAAAKGEFEPLRKLLLLSRDFVTLLKNFVSLDIFYNDNIEDKAIFQSGILVIDQRICHLCVTVNDMAKQDAQAGQSGMFLIYCDCVSRKLGTTKKIVAAVTMGEIKNLREGKNAVFYDRQGNDYDATITKVIDNPISIRQAFWSPYRKFGQWVTDLINKSAAEKNDKAFADMTAKAEATAANPADAAAAEKKSAFDIAKFAGIFAAIGMALGYIGAFFTSLGSGLRDVFAMNWGFLIFIGIILGLMLVISGPAMIIAAIKLRRRNLAPILNANGWAVNADSIVNIPFGATLTEQVKFPLLAGQKKPLGKGAKWAIALSVIVVVALLVVVFFALKNGQCPIQLFCK